MNSIQNSIIQSRATILQYSISYNTYVSTSSDATYNYYIVTNTTNNGVITISNGSSKSFFYVAVAGGGGGSRGGGGGGGFLSGQLNSIANETITIAVGAGSAGIYSTNASNGANTTIVFSNGSNTDITCVGGGGGGNVHAAGGGEGGSARRGSHHHIARGGGEGHVHGRGCDKAPCRGRQAEDASVGLQQGARLCIVAAAAARVLDHVRRARVDARGRVGGH